MHLFQYLVCYLVGHDEHTGLARNMRAVHYCRRCGKSRPAEDWTEEELKKWAKGH